MTSKPTVIILNGPPGSGKDTIAELLVQHGFTHECFKAPLYPLTAMMYGVTTEWFKEVATDRILKEQPFDELNCGMTPRMALIDTSENQIKPYMGKDFFGLLAASRVKGNTVFSDGGFEEEIEPMIQQHSAWIFRLHREGFTFEGDSRSYSERGIDIYLEEGKPEKAVETILKIIKSV